MFITPNHSMLQTDVVTMQSAILYIKSRIQHIILNIDKIKQSELLQELTDLDNKCSQTIFTSKYEMDKIELEKRNLAKENA